MKKIISILLAAMLVTAFSGCVASNKSVVLDDKAEEHKAQIVDENVYDELTEQFCEYLIDPDRNADMEGTYGLEEVVQNERENAVNVVGYSVQDINDDGVPEFLVGLMNEYCRGPVENELNAMFTYKNNAPVLLFEGWSRNRHSLTEDGEIFVSGSNGASESMFGMYELPSGADALKSKAYYFSMMGADGKGQFFYNQTGERDAEASKRLFVNSEEFFAIQSDMTKKTVRLELKPFLNEKVEDKTEKVNKPASITVELANDRVKSSAEYDSVFVDNMQGSPELAFSTDVTVTDFRINRLDYDYSNNGQQHIFETPVYEYGSLNPDRTLVVKMSIPEGMAEYSISYIDTDGVKKSFNVLQSGETGEFFLYEITVE